MLCILNPPQPHALFVSNKIDCISVASRVATLTKFSKKENLFLYKNPLRPPPQHPSSPLELHCKRSVVGWSLSLGILFVPPPLLEVESFWVRLLVTPPQGLLLPPSSSSSLLMSDTSDEVVIIADSDDESEARPSAPPASLDDIPESLVGSAGEEGARGETESDSEVVIIEDSEESCTQPIVSPATTPPPPPPPPPESDGGAGIFSAAVGCANTVPLLVVPPPLHAPPPLRPPPSRNVQPREVREVSSLETPGFFVPKGRIKFRATPAETFGERLVQEIARACGEHVLTQLAKSKGFVKMVEEAKSALECQGEQRRIGKAANASLKRAAKRKRVREEREAAFVPGQTTPPTPPPTPPPSSSHSRPKPAPAQTIRQRFSSYSYVDRTNGFAEAAWNLDKLLASGQRPAHVVVVDIENCPALFADIAMWEIQNGQAFGPPNCYFTMSTVPENTKVRDYMIGHVLKELILEGRLEVKLCRSATLANASDYELMMDTLSLYRDKLGGQVPVTLISSDKDFDEMSRTLQEETMQASFTRLLSYQCSYDDMVLPSHYKGHSFPLRSDTASFLTQLRHRIAHPDIPYVPNEGEFDFAAAESIRKQEIRMFKSGARRDTKRRKK